jgi:hypothetical protein
MKVKHVIDLRKISIVRIFIFLLFHLNTNAQEKDKSPEKKPFHTRLDLSYGFGGQIYNDNFIYNPGYSIHIINSIPLHKDFELGLGVGYTVFENENFIPIYLEALGFKKKKKNAPFVNFQLGYSIGWDTQTNTLENYEMNGGIYFSAGLGRRIELSNHYSVLFQWSLCHQFASINYTIFGEGKYKETVNYDMLKITFGIIRQ